ncbi:MAG: redoxin domain-containing protein, partial [Planctomycetota bacterium]
MDKGQSSTELSTHPTQSCAVGSSAPLFTLEAIDAERKIVSISLSDFRSRWLVILFYPRDFSFVCPTEIIGFSSEKEQFDLRQCDLLGISIDSLDSHRAWLQTPVDSGGVEGLRFPLASDPTGDVCRAYGLWRPKEELPNRGLAVVDPEGELRYFAVFDLAVGRSVHDVLRMIDALKVGGLCPANWRNADGVLDVGKMLQPGRVLGHYRIERFIGAGGFAQVLSAHDLRLGRRVALKILAPRSDASEGMLLDEARMAARVNHPNVCTIYAVDVIDTVPTIVM